LGVSVAESNIKFIYNPSDGVEFIETMRMKKVQDLGKRGTVTDEITGTAEVTIVKKDDGFEMTATLLSMETKRNGQKLNDPISSMLVNLSIKYLLDHEGQLISISGYDQLIDKINSQLPPQMAQALSSVMNEEAMINKDAAEYDGRIGQFVGKEVKIGDAWQTQSQFPMPTGELINFNRITGFKEKANCGDGSCIKIEYVYDSDPAKLNGFSSQFSNIIDVLSKGEFETNLSELKVSGKGSCLVDPKTMLLYDETMSRVITMFMEIPGEGKVLTTMKEEREYTRDYK